MSIRQAFTTELTQESVATRKLLTAIPEEKFGWKPHEKSMTLGRLAGHIAEIPQWTMMMMDSTSLDMGDPNQTGDGPFEPTRREDLLAVFDRNLAAFQEALENRRDEDFGVTWELKMGDQVLTSMSRADNLRTWVINHLIHHRGQLSVYLRLLDLPLPPIYGPTADNPNFE